MSSSFFTRDNVNVDISHLCDLECPKCQRWTQYRKYKKKVPGKNLPLDDLDKLISHFRNINFCGQYSDPILHPQIHEMLSMCYQKTNVMVHTASSVKSIEWYTEAFKANPLARWIFSIDGLPDQSSLYRINNNDQVMSH